MPKKGGKAKAPAFLTDPDATAPFGFQVRSAPRTPLSRELPLFHAIPAEILSIKVPL
jgi:hypothetical protein